MVFCVQELHKWPPAVLWLRIDPGDSAVGWFAGRRRLSARKGRIKQRLAFRNSLGKSTAAGRTQSLAFFFQQLFLVCRIEHLLPAVIGAAMPGNLLIPVKNADRGFRSGQYELAADSSRRNGVIIEIKTDVDGFAGSHRDQQIGIEPMKQAAAADVAVSSAKASATVR